MKSLQYFALFTLSFVTLVSCKNEQTPEVKVVETSATEEIAQLDPNATYAKAEFTIEGMTCAMGCAKTIEKKIAGMDGVQYATVDFDKRSEEHTSELQSRENLVCRLLLEKKKKKMKPLKINRNHRHTSSSTALSLSRTTVQVKMRSLVSLVRFRTII